MAETYNNIEVDSDEEIATLMWLEELQNEGYIDKIERAESFVLSEKLENKYSENIQLKTKLKIIEKRQKLLHGHQYTPEFKITLSKKGTIKLLFNQNLIGINKKENLFIGKELEDGTSIIYLEIKGDWDAQNMTRLFKINRQWIWQKYNIFVNLVIPTILMENTFTPLKYRKTPTGRDKKINWEIKSINQFI